MRQRKKAVIVFDKQIEKLDTGISALKPLLNDAMIKSKSNGASEPIKWQELSRGFLHDNSEKEFTSAQILEGIIQVPKDKTVRRLYGIYLSQALKKLYDKEEILVKDNKGKRGKLYQFVK